MDDTTNVRSRREHSACAWPAPTGWTRRCCKCRTQSHAVVRGRSACGYGRGTTRKRQRYSPELYMGDAAPFREPSAGAYQVERGIR